MKKPTIPRTEAGRTLVQRMLSSKTEDRMGPDDLQRAILAIEQQAAAEGLDVERLEPILHDVLPHLCGPYEKRPNPYYVEVAEAILARLSRPSDERVPRKRGTPMTSQAAQEKTTSPRTEAGRRAQGVVEAGVNPQWQGLAEHGGSVSTYAAELILAIEREARAEVTAPLHVCKMQVLGEPCLTCEAAAVTPSLDGSDSLTFLALSQHLDHHTPMAAVRTFPRIDCRCGWEGFDWPVHFYGSILARLDEGSATPAALDVPCHRCEGRGWVDNSHDQTDPHARPICSCCAGTGKERTKDKGEPR